DAPARQLAAFPELLQAWRTLSERLSVVVKVAREAGQLVLAARGPKAPVASDGVATDLYAFARLLETLSQYGDTILSATSDPTGSPWCGVPYPQPGAAGPTGPGQRRGGRGPGGQGHGGKPPDARPDPPILVQPAAGEPVEAPTLHSAPSQVGALLEPL